MFGNSEYDDKCGGCYYFNYAGRSCPGRCDYFLDYHLPDEDKCDHYRRIRNDEYVKDKKDEDEDDKSYMSALGNEMLGFINRTSSLNALKKIRNAIVPKQEDSKGKVYKIGEMPSI